MSPSQTISLPAGLDTLQPEVLAAFPFVQHQLDRGLFADGFGLTSGIGDDLPRGVTRVINMNWITVSYEFHIAGRIMTARKP